MTAQHLFSHYPKKPKSAECQKAYTILCSAHSVAESFYTTFAAVRKARKAKGTTTDAEQDLLRASLVFAAAGLDSMAKQLIKDALPAVIDRHPGAQLQFQEFVERKMRSGPDPYELLAEAIASPNTRGQLIDRLIASLTSGSLQSHEEVLRTGAHFDIQSTAIVTNVDDLKDAFRARNQIVHEMDVDLDHVNRNRRSRQKENITKMVNTVFGASSQLLAQVDKKLQ